MDKPRSSKNVSRRAGSRGYTGDARAVWQQSPPIPPDQIIKKFVTISQGALIRDVQESTIRESQCRGQNPIPTIERKFRNCDRVIPLGPFLEWARNNPRVQVDANLAHQCAMVNQHRDDPECLADAISLECSQIRHHANTISPDEYVSKINLIKTMIADGRVEEALIEYDRLMKYVAKSQRDYRDMVKNFYSTWAGRVANKYEIDQPWLPPKAKEKLAALKWEKSRRLQEEYEKALCKVNAAIGHLDAVVAKMMMAKQSGRGRRQQGKTASRSSGGGDDSGGGGGDSHSYEVAA